MYNNPESFGGGGSINKESTSEKIPEYLKDKETFFEAIDLKQPGENKLVFSNEKQIVEATFDKVPGDSFDLAKFDEEGNINSMEKVFKPDSVIVNIKITNSETGRVEEYSSSQDVTEFMLGAKKRIADGYNVELQD